MDNDHETHVEAGVPKYRIWKTVAIYTGFIGHAFSVSSLGPAIISLSLILGTDIKTLGFLLTGGACVAMLGVLCSGFAFHRLNKELCLCLHLLTIAASTACLILHSNAWTFTSLNALRQFSLGYVEAGGQAYTLYLWQGTKYVSPIVQALHFLWSMGSSLGPVLIRMFIGDLSYHYNNSTFEDNESSSETQANTTHSVFKSDEAYYVMYGFILIGGLILAPVLLFGYICFLENAKLLSKTKAASRIACSGHSVKGTRKYLLVLCMALYAVFQLCIQILTTYGPAFVVVGFKWDSRTAALISSMFFIGNAIGRLACIPLSTILKPKTILVCCSVLATLALVMLCFFSSIHDAVIWGSFILVGISTSSMIPSMFLWMSAFINMTGMPSAIFVLGICTGRMVSTPITGYMFQTYSHMWVAYVPLIANINCVILFVSLNFMTRRLIMKSKHLTKQS